MQLFFPTPASATATLDPTQAAAVVAAAAASGAPNVSGSTVSAAGPFSRYLGAGKPDLHPPHQPSKPDASDETKGDAGAMGEESEQHDGTVSPG